MARQPQRNIPVGKRRSAACLAAVWIALVLWLVVSGRFLLAVGALIVGGIFGPAILMAGLQDAPLARRIIKTFLVTNIQLLFGCAATLLTLLLFAAFRTYLESGELPIFMTKANESALGSLFLLAAFTAAFSSGIVSNAADNQEHRVVRLYSGWFSRPFVVAAKRLALPNGIAMVILFPIGLWALIGEPDFLTPQIGLAAALIVFVCAWPCLLVYWLYLMPRMYLLSSRLLWRLIRRGG